MLLHLLDEVPAIWFAYTNTGLSLFISDYRDRVHVDTDPSTCDGNEIYTSLHKFRLQIAKNQLNACTSKLSIPQKQPRGTARGWTPKYVSQDIIIMWYMPQTETDGVTVSGPHSPDSPMPTLLALSSSRPSSVLASSSSPPSPHRHQPRHQASAQMWPAVHHPARLRGQ